MPLARRPAEGTWTEHYPELGTDLVSYEDSISAEHHDLECTAIFERTWLNVGRVEQCPLPGDRFSKEIHAANATVVVARDDDGRIQAFRGELPLGTAPNAQNPIGPLPPVRCDVWEGFVFVNFDPSDDVVPLQDYLGRFAAGLAGYPFGELTQVYAYRAQVRSNWKLYIDAFAEFYHAPVLHTKQYTGEEARKLMGLGYEGLHYELDGPHGMQSSWGGMAPPKDPMMVKPIERILRSGNFGAWDRPDIAGLDPLPAGLNPAGHPAWGLDSYLFFPNFMMVVWAPGWYLTYHYWPTAHNEHIFEGTLYFAPAKTARDRMRQELAAVTFKEFGLQDCNTLEATQTMLESRAVTHFPLNDQEVLLRALHKTAGDYVTAYLDGHEPPHVAHRQPAAS